MRPRHRRRRPPITPRTASQAASAYGRLADRGGYGPTVLPMRSASTHTHPHTYTQAAAAATAAAEQVHAVPATVPFVLDGVPLGQPVILAVTPVRLGASRPRWDPDAPGVAFVDMAELGATPVRIIPALTSFVDTFGGPGRPVRASGRPYGQGGAPPRSRSASCTRPC
jgi:hypothetical protein